MTREHVYEVDPGRMGGDKIKDTYEQVQTGENFQAFAERVGVHTDRLIELNDKRLEEEARAHGFSHTFTRHVPDEEGGATHPETGTRVRIISDRHVWPGQELVVARERIEAS